MIHLLINSVCSTGSLLHSLLPKKNLHLAQQPTIRVALHFAVVCHALNKAISRSFQHRFHHLMHEHFIFMNDHDFSFFLIQMFICMYHIKASTTSHKTKFSTVSNNSRRKKIYMHLHLESTAACIRRSARCSPRPETMSGIGRPSVLPCGTNR